MRKRLDDIQIGVQLTRGFTGAFVRLASGFFEYDIGRFDLLSILIHNALISKLAFFY